MANHPPDLRRLAVGLLTLSKTRLDVSDNDIKRVADSDNFTLVLLRVLTNVMARSGFAAEDIKRVVNEAKKPAGYMDAMFSSGVESTVETGVLDVYRVLSSVDEVLYSPRVPPWFRETYYPGVMVKMARGGKVSDRELEIMAFVVSRAKGEV